MILLIGELAQARRHALAPPRARRVSTSASTSSGATGKAPGSRTPSRSVCSQTARSCSTALPGSWPSSSSVPSARRHSSRSQQTPVSLGAAHRLRGPASRLVGQCRGRRRGAPGSARTSARRGARCRTTPPTRRAAARRRPTRRRAARARTDGAAAARTTTARPARRRRREASRRTARASPARPARRAAARRRARATRRSSRGRSRGAWKRSQTSSIGLPPRLRAQPSAYSAARLTSQRPLPATRQCLERRRLGLGDPLDAHGGIVRGDLREHGCPRHRVGALGERPLEEAPDVVVARDRSAREQQAARARAARPAGSDAKLGDEQVGQPLLLAGELEVARRARGCARHDPDRCAA